VANKVDTVVRETGERAGPPSVRRVSQADVGGLLWGRKRPRPSLARVASIPATLGAGVFGVVSARGAVAVGHEVGAAFAEVTAGHHRADARRLFESLGYDAAVTTYLRKRL